MLRHRIRKFAVVATFVVAALGANGAMAVPVPAETAATKRSAIPFTEGTVSQTPDGFDVAWVAKDAGTVTVYASTTPDSVSHDRVVGTGPSTGSVHVTGLPAAPRWYFELSPAKGEPLVVADRFLHLDSAPNFRDVGGYRTADGHWVKMGALYRSEALAKLSPADYDTVLALGINLVCDLRTDYERTKDPDPALGAAANAVFDAAGDSDKTKQITEAITSGDPVAQQRFLGDGKAARLLVDGGKGLVSATTARKAYAAMFTRLATPGSLPSVMHCSAGKDRTGWASAAVLTLAGVPRPAVERDYLLSNDALKASNERTLMSTGSLINADLLEPLLTVRPAYLDASFSEVRKVYGTFDRYLTKGLGLTPKEISALRRELLVG